jgi:hypothetical protein
MFAAILLAVIGCFNLNYGIAAIANSHVFVANAHYVFGNLRAWGWITLIIGVMQLLAATGVFSGNQVACCLPVLVADHHRHGRGCAAGPVRPRQPPEHRSRRLMREAAIPAPVGRTHDA